MESPVIEQLDAIVADYLRRFDQAAAGLPYDRRVELVGEIAEHITQARATGTVTTEAGLRELLDRLGEPEDIVAAARDDDEDADGPFGARAPYPPPYSPYPPPPPYAPPPVHYRTPGTGLEIAAIALMTVGSIIPIFGWLVGTILLWTSRRLRVGEKLLMTLVVPGGPLVVIPLMFFGGQSCSSSSSSDSLGNSVQGPTVCTGFAFPVWLGIPLLVVALVAPFVVGGILLKRATARAQLEPPVASYAPTTGPARWGGLEIAAVLLLAFGGFVIPFIGPIAGLACAWMSQAWTTTEKWIATAIAASALLLVAGALSFLVL